jgi:transcriptional regulator with XRE-family HTH domain
MNPESLYAHIGEVIRTRRRSLKPRLTQESLAQIVGMSRAALANIETGRQNVMVHQLYAFAKALKIDVTDFLPPADRTAVGEEWSGVMPSDLKPKQQEQIARLLAETQAEAARDKESHADKQRKR